jgi:16S rRNA processing protein RimM
MPLQMIWDDMIVVGRIVRPQGNRGEVVVASSTDFGEERFRIGERVWVQRHGSLDTLAVASSREHDGRWVVGFAGFATIDDAETLRGLELRIPAETLKPLDAGSHYVHDLIGCQVALGDGSAVGIVRDVQLDAGIPLLVVDGAASEVLVPFTSEICRRVDVEARQIVIAPPEGLVELNETRKSHGR